jgi:hypothetical protein
MDLKRYFIILGAICLFCVQAKAQDGGLEFTLDATSSTIALPQIFSPAIDLSGRGFNSELTWPQELASREVIESWSKDVGFKGMYRLQYNLWEIGQLEKNLQLQRKLLANYESIIRKINDAGQIVILDIFSTPQGQGKVLDKKSSPVDPKAFKALVKNYIRHLSCEKKYNIWYEVWTAPDLDIFFLGRQQEYLGLYKAVAEAVRELESEYRIHIPLGGPSSSWWFRSGEGNTVITPEKSLIYELIKFCYHYKLPLDFISWHAYSTDPRAEKEMTTYNKTSVALLRDWLYYFNFPKDMPLIVDEWNYDSGQNVLPERKEKSYIGASFIPSRLRHMYEADINYQLFFSLEDFQDNLEGVARNVGAFWFEPSETGYAGGNKAIYNVFRMLSKLGPDMYISPSKISDEFIGMVATRSEDSFAILIYNYIDPDIFRSFLSRNIATLGDGERKSLLDIFKSDTLERIKRREVDINSLRIPGKTKNLLKRAQDVFESSQRLIEAPRELKLGIKNLKNDYLYTRYSIDSACGFNCEFAPAEEKSIAFSDGVYGEKLILKPYSVHLIVLKPKPVELKVAPAPKPEEPEVSPAPVAAPEKKEPVVEATNTTVQEAAQNATAAAAK